MRLQRPNIGGVVVQMSKSLKTIDVETVDKHAIANPILEKYGVSDLIDQLSIAIAKADVELAATTKYKVNWNIQIKIITQAEHNSPSEPGEIYTMGAYSKPLPKQEYIKDVTPKESRSSTLGEYKETRDE